MPDPNAIRYVMAWHPPPEALAGLPNLAVIFSLGAGVEHILSREALPDVPVVRIVSDDLTRRMTEWVTLQVLMHHRQQRRYDRLQRERRWHELRQPAASEVRVGIMGMGVLGKSAAEVLVKLGFQVAGWSRRPKTIAGVESFHGEAGLDAFLARTDILVVLLPLTPETRGLLSMPLFGKLARDGALGGPVLINAGRGGLQVEADIVRAHRGGRADRREPRRLRDRAARSGEPALGTRQRRHHAALRRLERPSRTDPANPRPDRRLRKRGVPLGTSSTGAASY